MKTKTCGECRYMLHKDTFEVCTHSMTETSMFGVACKHFEPPTNGDKIRRGGDKALLAYRSNAACYSCSFRGTDYCKSDFSNCKDGQLAWLNAPAESEGEDD